MSYSSFFSSTKSLSMLSFIVMFSLSISVVFGAEEGLPFETQVQAINGHIQKKELPQAQTTLDQFWAEHSREKGFVEAIRQVKDVYWQTGEHAAHFALCERIVKAFPDDPLAVATRADLVTGYIFDKDLAKAAEKLEEFWTHCSSKGNFTTYLKIIGDVYRSEGYTKEYDALSARIVQVFPKDSLALEIITDEIVGDIRAQNTAKASDGLEQFWAAHKTDKGFISDVRRVKDQYWMSGKYNEHFALCERIIREFPNDPLAMATRADLVTGYIYNKDLAKASEKLEAFWTHDHSDGHFLEYARTIKDVYWQEGDYADHFAVCDRIINEFPDDPLAVTTRVDVITGNIKTKNLAKASDLLEQFWTKYHSDDRFVEYARCIKDAYWQSGDHAAHYAVCDRIIKEFPDHPLTVTTWIDEIVGYIEDKQLAEASEKLEQFWTHDHSDERFVDYVYKIKTAYWGAGDHAAHFALSDRIIKEFPDHPRTMDFRRDEITGYIQCDMLSQAEEKLPGFLEDFGTDQRLPECLNAIAGAYHDKEDYPNAKDLYQRVLAQNPSADQQLQAYTGIARASIWLGESDAAIDATVLRLMTDYKATPGIGQRVFEIAEEYYYQGQEAKNDNSRQAQAYFSRAVAIWEKNINQINDSYFQCRGYFYSAAAYQDMKDYENAVLYYSTVVDKWPDYEYAANALYLEAKCLELLPSQDTLSKGQIMPQIKKVYELLIEKYPSSKVGQEVLYELANMEFNDSQWQKAIHYFEMFIQQNSGNPKISSSLYMTAASYEALGDLTQAKLFYNEYLQSAPTDYFSDQVREKLKAL